MPAASTDTGSSSCQSVKKELGHVLKMHTYVLMFDKHLGTWKIVNIDIESVILKH